MSEQSTGTDLGSGPDGRPRLQPRPLDSPPVDADQAEVFGRPSGVHSAFDRSRQPGLGEPAGSSGGLSHAPPQPEALHTAFSRPPDNPDTLQRPPGETPDSGAAEDHFWSGEQEQPWRDPGAAAVLGPPAVGEDAAPPTSSTAAPLLSVPELLFGRRVKPRSLLVLLLVTLLVGAAGGAAGWALGRGGNALTDGSATLAQVDPGVERAPDSIAGVADRVSPAVVSLEVQSGSVGAVGSGVVIDSDGYVLTNNHVVSVGGAAKPKITAVFTDGSKVPAAVVGKDPKTDLAVLKVDVTNPTVIQMGKSADLAVGDRVIAIGSPLGLASTVTSGIVSALHRAIATAGKNGGPPIVYDAIQTDAPINHGNSGGALVDSSGALVGINSAISSPSKNGGSIGLGFAIPIDQAHAIATSLIRNGKVTHADLGANVRSVSAHSSEGAEVVNVTKDGAAAEAGIAEGDVVTKVGDRPITDAAELQAAVLEHAPGDKVAVTVVRQGVQHTLQVTLQSD